MLKDIPASYIQHLLAVNPNAISFPMGGHGFGADVSRATLQAEMDGRAPVAVTNKMVGMHAIKK